MRQLPPWNKPAKAPPRQPSPLFSSSLVKKPINAPPTTKIIKIQIHILLISRLKTPNSALGLKQKRRELPLGCLPVFEAFALPLHWISNDKKAHAREICIFALLALHGYGGRYTIYQRRHSIRCITFNAEKLRSFRIRR